jgi:hypothetical protein
MCFGAIKSKGYSSLIEIYKGDYSFYSDQTERMFGFTVTRIEPEISLKENELATGNDNKKESGKNTIKDKE